LTLLVTAVMEPTLDAHVFLGILLGMMKIPKKASEKGQLTLYIKGQDRIELLETAARYWTDARSLSDAVFQSLRDWHFVTQGFPVAGMKKLRTYLDAVPRIYPDPGQKEDRCAAFYLLYAGDLMGHVGALQRPDANPLGRSPCAEQVEALDQVRRALEGHPTNYNMSNGFDGFWEAMSQPEIAQSESAPLG